MGQRYLLDTNICLYFLNRTMLVEAFNFVAGVLDKSGIFISVISQIELLGFRFPSFEEQIATEDFVIDSNILELDNEIVNKTIEIQKK